jgi:nitrate reductase beta subunit
VPQDRNMRALEEEVKASYEQVFMLYLPRICEHCLNPSCVASCPSGAMYKREEDGIVLVDQERCRGWRMCVSGCPYKKVYFNWRSGKAEKCTLCYPRIEAGLPTVCSETCVGRIRYLGLVLYDADRVEEAASVPDERDLLDAQLNVFLDPEDPFVQDAARRDGIAEDWIEAARRSPVYALALRYRIALPLHPEYRTLPMVWYVPPLSPVMSTIEGTNSECDPDDVFPAIDRLRIPIRYLANLLSAGDEEVIRGVLKRLAAMRGYMRELTIGGAPNADIAAQVGMTPFEIEEMYRLLAIAKYEDRYVVPAAHTELAGRLVEQQGSCGLDFEGGPGSCAVEAYDGEAFHLSQDDLDLVAMAQEPAPLEIVQVPRSNGL